MLWPDTEQSFGLQQIGALDSTVGLATLSEGGPVVVVTNLTFKAVGWFSNECGWLLGRAGEKTVATSGPGMVCLPAVGLVWPLVLPTGPATIWSFFKKIYLFPCKAD